MNDTLELLRRMNLYGCLTLFKWWWILCNLLCECQLYECLKLFEWWWILCNQLCEKKILWMFNIIWMTMDMMQSIMWMKILWMINVNWIMGILCNIFLTWKFWHLKLLVRGYRIEIMVECIYMMIMHRYVWVCVID